MTTGDRRTFAAARYPAAAMVATARYPAAAMVAAARYPAAAMVATGVSRSASARSGLALASW